MARRIAQVAFIASVDQSPYGTGLGFDYPGGIGKMMASATWSGGNARLEMLGPDGSTWLPVDQYAQASVAQLTANGMVTFIAPAGRMRVNITTATNVNASVVGCPENVAG
ncbi:hypothetical protein UFOVP16_29 [uncultured Caudovirales phage]|uniref:Uncharacterized protein n=1 Tax=uncultured Caudovirales phage TaxID=2100421 RepID=A0A6J5KIJ0_9CAUD|nr:hypothetical protein UFOVP16_29 [uncultured Caudovirales phage]